MGINPVSNSSVSGDFYVEGDTIVADDIDVQGGDVTNTLGSLNLEPNAEENLTITLSGAGDFVVNTDDLYVDTSLGYVGINTTTPGSELDVKGDLRLSGSSSGYIGFSPAADAGSTTYILPSADGGVDYILSTDGAGNLSWEPGSLIANAKGGVRVISTSAEMIAVDPGDPTKLAVVNEFILRTYDNTDPSNISISEITVSTQTGITHTIPASTTNWVAVRNNGGTEDWLFDIDITNIDFDEYTIVARAFTDVSGDIAGVTKVGWSDIHFAKAFYDYHTSVYFIKKLQGGEITPGSGALTYTREEGVYWKFMSYDGFESKGTDAQLAPSIYYTYGEDPGYEELSVMEVGFYDDPSTGKTAVPDDKWSIYYIYHFPVGNFEGLQRGDRYYDSLHEARMLKGAENVMPNDDFQAATLTHIVYIKKGATDASNEEEIVFEKVNDNSIATSGDPIVASLQSSGLVDWTDDDILSINTDTTKFDTAEFRVARVDRSDGEVKFLRTVAATIANTVTDITIDPITHIGYNIDSDIIVQQNAPFGRSTLDNIIPLGKLWHRNRTNLDLALTMPLVIESSHDFAGQLLAFNALKQSGCVLEANSDQSVDVSSGILEVLGGNNTSRNLVNIASPAADAPLEFTPVYNSATSTAIFETVTSTIDFTVYDDGTGTLHTLLNNNKYGIHYLYISPYQATIDYFLIRGSDEYDSLADATDALGTIAAPVPTDLTGLFCIGAVIGKKDTTDIAAGITNSTAAVIQADRFGTFGGGGGGSGSITALTMQETYDDSVTPEIVTDSTRLAVTFKDGTGTTTNNVIEVLDNSDVEVFGVTSDDVNIEANLNLSEYIYHKDDTDTYLRFTDDKMDMYCGGDQFFTAQEAGASSVFQIGNNSFGGYIWLSASTRYAVVVDGTNNGYVGINTAAPTERLHVTGNGLFTGDIEIQGGDLTTDQTTFNLINTIATTLNIGGVSTATSIGAATGTTTIGNDLTVTNNLTVSGGSTVLGTTNTTTIISNASASFTMNLPVDIGTVDQVLATDGVNTLSWVDAAKVDDGTVTNNTLRWDGSTWVESTALTNDGTDIAATGDLDIQGGDITNSTGALTITPLAGNSLNIILSTTGDFAVNTDDLYVDTSTGFVGIGNTAPDYELDINGSAALSASTTEARSLLIGDGRTGDGLGKIYLITDSTYTTGSFGLERIGGANADSYLNHRGTGALYLWAKEEGDFVIGTDNQMRMSIDSLGNLAYDVNTFVVDAVNNRVGIGTSTPSYDFHVNVDNSQFGTGTVGTLLMMNDESHGIAVGSNTELGTTGISGTATVVLSGTNGSFAYITATGTGSLPLTTPIVKFFVDGDGSVGIGQDNTTPASILHVDSGAANTTSIMTLENTSGDFNVFRTDSNPEGSITADIGDIAVDSTNANLYLKLIGSGNTGWNRMVVSDYFMGDVSGTLTTSGTGLTVAESEADTNHITNNGNGSITLTGGRTYKLIAELSPGTSHNVAYWWTIGVNGTEIGQRGGSTSTSVSSTSGQSQAFAIVSPSSDTTYALDSSGSLQTNAVKSYIYIEII